MVASGSMRLIRPQSSDLPYCRRRPRSVASFIRAAWRLGRRDLDNVSALDIEVESDVSQPVFVKSVDAVVCRHEEGLLRAANGNYSAMGAAGMKGFPSKAS